MRLPAQLTLFKDAKQSAVDTQLSTSLLKLGNPFFLLFCVHCINELTMFRLSSVICQTKERHQPFLALCS